MLPTPDASAKVMKRRAGSSTWSGITGLRECHRPCEGLRSEGVDEKLENHSMKVKGVGGRERDSAKMPPAIWA